MFLPDSDVFAGLDCIRIQRENGTQFLYKILICLIMSMLVDAKNLVIHREVKY